MDRMSGPFLWERDRRTDQDNESSETCIYNVRCAHVELWMERYGEFLGLGRVMGGGKDE